MIYGLENVSVPITALELGHSKKIAQQESRRRINAYGSVHQTFFIYLWIKLIRHAYVYAMLYLCPNWPLGSV